MIFSKYMTSLIDYYARTNTFNGKYAEQLVVHSPRTCNIYNTSTYLFDSTNNQIFIDWYHVLFLHLRTTSVWRLAGTRPFSRSNCELILFFAPYYVKFNRFSNDILS